MLPNLPDFKNPNIKRRKQDQQFAQILDKWVKELLSVEKKEPEIQKALFSIFQRLFQLLFDLNNQADLIKESMNSLIFTSTTLYNIRFYLRQNLPSVMPFGKVFNKHGRRYTFQMEGFESNSSSSGDEKQVHKGIQKINPHTKQHNEDLEIIADLKFKINVLQDLIKDKENKLNLREQTITQMTSGYLKDIHHLREMYTRKQDDPNLFVYEVTYYDAQTNLDPEVKSFIEVQVSNALIKAREKIEQMNEIVRIQQQENQQLKKSIQILVSNQDLQKVVQTLFLMEPDKYKIWKVIQDQVGNEEIFKIFEDVKEGYGIDYREINELIGKSQASWREYQVQKNLMEIQLNNLIKSSRQEIKRLNDLLKDKDNQLHSLHQQFEYDNMQAKRETKIMMESHFKQREQSLFKQFQRVKDQVLTKWIKTDIQDLVYKTMTKSALIKWRHYSMFLKIYPIMQTYKVAQSLIPLTELDYCNFDTIRQHLLKQLTNRNVSIEQKSNKADSEIIDELREEINFQMEQNAEITLERDSISKHSKGLEVKLQKYKNDLAMLQHSYNISQTRQREIEYTFNLFEKPYYYILKRLGYQELQIKIGTFKKIGKSVTGLDMESFLQKLTELSISKEDLLRMCHNEFIKGQIAFDIITQTSAKIDVSTITDISDINYEMSFIENLIRGTNIEIDTQQINQKNKIKKQIAENAESSSEDGSIRDEKTFKQNKTQRGGFSNSTNVETHQKTEQNKKIERAKKHEQQKKPESINISKKQTKKSSSPKFQQKKLVSLPLQIPKERIKNETPVKQESSIQNIEKQRSISPPAIEKKSSIQPTSQRQTIPQKQEVKQSRLDSSLISIGTQTFKTGSKTVAVQTFMKNYKLPSLMNDVSVQVQFHQSNTHDPKALFSVGVQTGSQIGLCHLTQIASNDQQFSLSVRLKEPDMSDVYYIPQQFSKHFLNDIQNRKNDCGSKKRYGGQSVRLTTLITQKNIQKLGQSLEPIYNTSPIESKGHNIVPRIGFQSQKQVQKKLIFSDMTKQNDHYQTLFNEHRKKAPLQPKESASIIELSEKRHLNSNLQNPYKSLAPDFIYENT